MYCSHVTKLPAASCDFQVLVMVPPQPVPALPASVYVIVVAQLSVPVAVPVLAGKILAPQAMVMFAGQVMVGASLSTTVTVNEQVAVAPFAAVTLNVLVVVPTGKVAPDAMPAVWVVIAPGQLSVPTGAI
jgi:hypothetical protein